MGPRREASQGQPHLSIQQEVVPHRACPPQAHNQRGAEAGGLSTGGRDLGKGGKRPRGAGARPGTKLMS